jgi:protein phosphatase PTC1
MEEPQQPTTPLIHSSTTDDNDAAKTDSNNENKAGEKKNCTAVTDYGACADQNHRYRRRMEDAHYMEDGYNGDPHSAFFAIYDGHGGKEAAHFSAQNLHKLLAEELNKHGADVYKNSAKVLEIISTTYLATDDKIKAVVPGHHGCTAVTCLLVGHGDDRHLFAANAGDARAVLCRDGKAIRLTEDHKASEPVEAKRIQDIGGFIINGRVNGQIIITRSLGDHNMKEYIIGTPFTHYEKLSEKDTHLIVACDGLWDVVEDQQAVDFVLQHTTECSASELSKRLLVKALQDGSTDNLSVIVIKL